MSNSTKSTIPIGKLVVSALVGPIVFYIGVALFKFTPIDGPQFLVYLAFVLSGLLWSMVFVVIAIIMLIRIGDEPTKKQELFIWILILGNVASHLLWSVPIWLEVT